MIVNSKNVEQVIIIFTTIGVIIVLLVAVVIGGWIFWKHKLKTCYEIAQIQQSKRKI